jgi:hypothetical protein
MAPSLLLFVPSSVVPQLGKRDEINVWMMGTTDGRVGKLADERQPSWGITPPLTVWGVPASAHRSRPSAMQRSAAVWEMV